MADQFNLDEITRDARANLVGQTGAPASSLPGTPNLGPALGVGLATSASQGLLGWYTWKK